MTQESLRFDRLHTVADSAREVYRHVGDAVASLGLLQAAGACGIDRGDLRRSLDRDGRRVAVEHAMSIAALTADSNPTLAEKICAALVRPAGLEVCQPGPPLTDAERAARLEAALRSLGPVGDQLMQQALGGRR
jgi:hypothetical protein